MPTLGFPTDPHLGDTYSVGTKTYIWNGVAWAIVPGSSQSTVSSLTATSSVYITSGTISTSTLSGSLVVAGGVGIGGNVYIANTSYIDGAQIITTATIGNYAATASTSTTSTFSILNNTQSTSTTTGALVVFGGAGIGGRLNAESVKIADTVFDSGLVSINTTDTVVIDSYSSLDYRAAKYLIQIDDGTGALAKFQVIEILLLIDNIGTVFATEYGVLTTNGELGAFAADVQGNTVNLYFTAYMPTNKILSLLRTGMVA